MLAQQGNQSSYTAIETDLAYNTARRHGFASPGATSDDDLEQTATVSVPFHSPARDMMMEPRWPLTGPTSREVFGLATR